MKYFSLLTSEQHEGISLEQVLGGPFVDDTGTVL